MIRIRDAVNEAAARVEAILSKKTEEAVAAAKARAEHAASEQICAAGEDAALPYRHQRARRIEEAARRAKEDADEAVKHATLVANETVQEAMRAAERAVQDARRLAQEAVEEARRAAEEVVEEARRAAENVVLRQEQQAAFDAMEQARAKATEEPVKSAKNAVRAEGVEEHFKVRKDAIAHATDSNIQTAMAEAGAPLMNLLVDQLASYDDVCWHTLSADQKMTCRLLVNEIGGTRYAHQLCVIGVCAGVGWYDAKLEGQANHWDTSNGGARLLCASFDIDLKFRTDGHIARSYPNLKRQLGHLQSCINSGRSKSSSSGVAQRFPRSTPSPFDDTPCQLASTCLNDGRLSVKHKFSRCQKHVPFTQKAILKEKANLDEGKFNQSYGPESVGRDPDALFTHLSAYDYNDKLVEPKAQALSTAFRDNMVKCSFVLEAWHKRENGRDSDVITATLVEIRALGPAPSEECPATPPRAAVLGEPVTPTSGRRIRVPPVGSPSKRARIS